MTDSIRKRGRPPKPRTDNSDYVPRKKMHVTDVSVRTSMRQIMNMLKEEDRKAQTSQNAQASDKNVSDEQQEDLVIDTVPVVDCVKNNEHVENVNVSVPEPVKEEEAPSPSTTPKPKKKTPHKQQNKTERKAKQPKDIKEQTEEEKRESEEKWEKMKQALQWAPPPRVRNSSIKATRYLSGNVSRVVEETNTPTKLGFMDEFLTGGTTVTVFSLHDFTHTFMQRVLKQQANL